MNEIRRHTWRARALGWCGKSRFTETYQTPAAALLSELEMHFDLREHLDRLSVEQRGTVDPLHDRIDRRPNQPMLPADHLQSPNRAVSCGDRLQLYDAGDARLLGERRVERHRLMNDLCRLYDASHAHRVPWWCWRLSGF